MFLIRVVIHVRFRFLYRSNNFTRIHVCSKYRVQCRKRRVLSSVNAAIGKLRYALKWITNRSFIIHPKEKTNPPFTLRRIT